MPDLKQLNLRRLIFKLGWETSTRNRDVARVICPLLAPNDTILDAGSGYYGIRTFLPGLNVVSLDINFVENKVLQADLTRLPFSDEQFRLTTCIDVLELLSPAEREQALGELVRVTREALCVAFPTGSTARQADEAFRQMLARMRKAEPVWLGEHLHNPYPDVEWFTRASRSAAQTLGRTVVDVRILYSENIRVSRFIRFLAARSGRLSIVGNLICGALHAFIPKPGWNNSYRAIILVRFG
jgi:hypothetical protein